MFFGRRVVTEGAWMQMKKPAWVNMPVLNVSSLSTETLTLLEEVYDNVAEKEMDAIANLDQDLTRKMIDDSISKVLKIPDLSTIRELLAREPGLSTRRI